MMMRGFPIVFLRTTTVSGPCVISNHLVKIKIRSKTDTVHRRLCALARMGFEEAGIRWEGECFGVRRVGRYHGRGCIDGDEQGIT